MVLPKKHTSATEVKRGVQVMAVASLMAVGVFMKGTLVQELESF